MHATHEVFNQPEPLVDHHLFSGNQPLRALRKADAAAALAAGHGGHVFGTQGSSTDSDAIITRAMPRHEPVHSSGTSP